MSDITQRDLEALRVTLDKLDHTIDTLRAEIANTYVRKDVNDPAMAAFRAAIGRHDDWLTWAQRIVIGAVLLALLALAFQGGTL